MMFMAFISAALGYFLGRRPTPRVYDWEEAITSYRVTLCRMPLLDPARGSRGALN